MRLILESVFRVILNLVIVNLLMWEHILAALYSILDGASVIKLLLPVFALKRGSDLFVHGLKLGQHMLVISECLNEFFRSLRRCPFQMVHRVLNSKD